MRRLTFYRHFFTFATLPKCFLCGYACVYPLGDLLGSFWDWTHSSELSPGYCHEGSCVLDLLIYILIVSGEHSRKEKVMPIANPTRYKAVANMVVCESGPLCVQRLSVIRFLRALFHVNLIMTSKNRSPSLCCFSGLTSQLVPAWLIVDM